MLTNHHVLPSEAMSVRSEAHFSFERDLDGVQTGPCIFQLAPGRLFHTSEVLDFSVVAVGAAAVNADMPLSAYGFLPLVESTGKVSEGEWLSIIQHPNGELKQVCVRENKLVKRTENELRYSTDTLGGSSGSPVFNNDWYVVALHHSGVPLKVDGKVQTTDGRDFDPDRDGEDKIKWIANEGIRVSRIVNHLRNQQGGHPLLQDVFDATPASARLPDAPLAAPNTVPAVKPSLIAVPAVIVPATPLCQPEATTMNTPDYAQTARPISVTLNIDSNGQVSLASAGAAYESATATEAGKPAPKTPAFDVPFDASYKDRKGFDPEFLGSGAHRINLPGLTEDLQTKASRLLKPANGNDHVLHYYNYSLVMHAPRRFAMYTAANVRHSERYKMSRPADVWREDPRIPLEHQVSNFYYKGNQFDRGHLTRREDLEFGGSAKIALMSAADTCHWTNCTPQHAKFNQGKELWQGLEGYVLEAGLIHGQFDVQVITGPILEEDDPVYKPFPKIQYPVRFWKVVATLDADKKLFATAYILDQSEMIAQFGIEATVPFGAYKTFQVKIAEVERLTGLKFTSGELAHALPLSDCDPLQNRKPASRRRPVSLQESAQLDAPEGYLPLADVSDVYLG